MRLSPSAPRPRFSDVARVATVARVGRRVVVSSTVLAAGLGLVVSPALAAASGSGVGKAPSLLGQTVSGMMPAGAPDASGASTSKSTPGFQSATSVPYLLGTDVSSYQHPAGQAINWAQVAASGETFTVVKATESTNYTNPYVMTDVLGARSAGLLVGLYHFAHPEFSPTAQADYFARQINGIGGTLLPPVLDLESNGGLSSSALISWTSNFLTRLRLDTGRVPMIYSGPYFWSTSMAGSTAFSQYPLWEAHYTTAAAPQYIPGWPTWSLWQYTDGSYGSPAAVPGIPAHVDRDRFAGTKAQLLALAASSRPGVQPPFKGTATSAQFPDGTFVRVNGDPHVYVIAGLAPIWVTNWWHIGGPRAVRVISVATYYTLRSSPVDGTFLNDWVTGRVYRMAGGAPLLVTSWTPFGGGKPSVLVDDWDITNAGACGSYCSLLMKPRDGTLLCTVETGQVFVVAGGAPVFVSTWAVYGGPQPYVNITLLTVQNAGSGSWYNHLSFVPADGTVLNDSSTGQLYMVTGGAPLVANAGTLGTTPFTLVDHVAILNAGGQGVWAHLA